MGETADYDKSATPSAHASTHQDGGADEISVAALSGQLADAQPSTWTLVSGKPTTFTPAAHKTSHQDGGADEISVTGLSGTLADPQTPAAHKTSHQDGGADEISVTGLSGHLADAQDPVAHNTTHDVGGSDALTSYATNPGEGHVTVLGPHYLSITAGTWVWFVASQFLAGVFYNSSDAQNDRINFSVYLAKGTYTFDIITVTGSAYAIISLLLDGVSQGTIDCYVAGGPNYTQKKTIANITISTSALLTISLKAATRNASCTNWYIAFHSFAFQKTA